MSAAVSLPTPETSSLRRILIAGGPGIGKSTLAARLHEQLGYRVINTDAIRHAYGWSEVSLVASSWFDLDGPWIIEGVAVPRALRKWLERHPEGKPADVVYWGEIAREPRTPGQEAMAKGCATVWNEVHGELLRRRVCITVF